MDGIGDIGDGTANTLKLPILFANFALAKDDEASAFAVV